MKKIVFAMFLLVGITTYAQNDSNSLSQGSWIIEANTGSWTTGSTAFSLVSTNGFTLYSVGAEGGYFVADNLALKVGLGYSGGDDMDGTFNYKVGVKYYIINQIPLGLDYTGASSNGNGASWVGVQGGYAWFVANNVSIEPTIRYNMTLDEDKADSAFQGLIGFAFHF
ncbi:hypothetical protein Murru_1718 [Allomuricauda ruestringensis DSM 13258]|uniref:Outer membrane protein beta-barrel domain-containing protein n=1 Tax=Allomuricauda ruestringensis (strain DSM 13258 / CIP 107369 / LMG 19739 / B1) TaxID=886377 RepID=G2PIV9_ALLRU|nr:hypothetical protein [Allomuricauda ruestringensis]AEM70758.1 hypothetical protein Murru_1718 [Allomuricauda ruestringensis DSM 13258]